MAETKLPVETGGYGYGMDEGGGNPNPFKFGLNAGVAYLTKFSYIPNGGKDGAEQDALDIVFTINGTEKNYRLFPVTSGFDKNGNKVTDPNSTEFRDAVKSFNAVVTHILHTFVGEDVIKAAFARPIHDFKQFCDIAKSLLPGPTTPTIALDIFMQYQWQLGTTAKKTYLDIPNKMKQGRWLCKAVQGDWQEVRVDNPADELTKALYYVNKSGAFIEKDGVKVYTEEHPFFKNGWFMNSNYAKQQKADGSAEATTSYTAGVSEDVVTENGMSNPPVAEQTAPAW